MADRPTGSHSSAAMTLETYGSLFEEDLEALADRIDERYE